MEIVKFPKQTEWKSLLKRPQFDFKELYEKVQTVIDTVKNNGDKALIEYTEQFDKVHLDAIEVSPNEIAEAELLVSKKLKEAIEMARRNIYNFHSEQLLDTRKIETTPGVTCWQKQIGIEKVGLYIPGGTAPLFSTVLMLGIPAQIAECKEVVLCSPPNSEGKIHPAILYAAKIAGIHRIFKIGGTQAIAAMAHGTETVPKVYKIFGPGNQFVTAAKQIVSLKEVAIDMPAGPSEVAIIADETARPDFVAADMLSQAEHGVDSQSVLFTTSEELVEQVQEQLALQLAELPRKELAAKSLENSKIFLLSTIEEVVDICNEYAPEHLIICTQYYEGVADAIINAGSVFLGNFTPESAGDYASGTNHTLPTNGYAKAYSGVNLDSFMRKITFQHITRAGLLNLGGAIEIMAENEQLMAHKRAVTLRLDADKSGIIE